MACETKFGGGTSPVSSGRRRAQLTGFSDGTYETDYNGVPLARPLPRPKPFARITSSLTWSRGSHEVSSDGPNSARSVLDANFQNDLLQGLNRRQPEKCLSVLKGRRKGTMSAASECTALPRKPEDVRRRQEHIDGRIVQMPVLFPRATVSGVNERDICLVREAFLSELRDLYTILSSIDARKYDICRSDIRAMFEWFTTFENFLRLYFTVSETRIYQATEIDEWGKIDGLVSKERRKREKIKIIDLCDRVEAMKRVLISEGDRGEQKSVMKLKERVDKLTVRLVRFLDEEAEGLPAELSSRFSKPEVEVFFRGLVNAIRDCEHGRNMVVVLAKGLGKDSNGMGGWLVEMCDKGNRVTVQKWMHHFVERHSNYVKVFEKAESEYRRLYNSLSSYVDEEIEEIRGEFGRRLCGVGSSGRGSSGAGKSE